MWTILDHTRKRNLNHQLFCNKRQKKIALVNEKFTIIRKHLSENYRVKIYLTDNIVLDCEVRYEFESTWNSEYERKLYYWSPKKACIFWVALHLKSNHSQQSWRENLFATIDNSCYSQRVIVWSGMTYLVKLLDT